MIKSSQFKKTADDALQITLKKASGYKHTPAESFTVTIRGLERSNHYAKDGFCKISKCSQEELIGQDSCVINLGYHLKSNPHDCQPN